MLDIKTIMAQLNHIKDVVEGSDDHTLAVTIRHMTSVLNQLIIDAERRELVVTANVLDIGDDCYFVKPRLAIAVLVEVA